MKIFRCASRFVVLALVVFGFRSSFAQSTIKIGNTYVQLDTVITGIDVPWEMMYAADGNLWITERKGLVSRVNPVTKNKTVVLDITSTVYAQAEAGLLGMALVQDSLIRTAFIVHTYSTQAGVKEKLVKYSYIDGALANPVVILDGIEGGTAHNGSRLLLCQDGTLLMTTGDSQYGPRAQDLSSLNGKVLRINQDGTVPWNNPFPGNLVYTFGHRNSQGICQTRDGRVFISEHGPESDDEFQELIPGRNYGWPNVLGFCDTPAEMNFCAAMNVKEPLFHWTPTIAPDAVMYYENDSFPEFHQKFLMTTLKTKMLVALKLDSSHTTAVSESWYLANMFGRLRCIARGPRGEIYLGTNGAESYNIDPNTHSIIRIVPPGYVYAGIRRTAAGIPARCYPHFATDQLTVETEPGVAAVVEIRDATGRLVNSRQMSGSAHIDVSDLAGGVYVVTVVSDGQILIREKIVKGGSR